MRKAGRAPALSVPPASGAAAPLAWPDLHCEAMDFGQVNSREQVNLLLDDVATLRALYRGAPGADAGREGDTEAADVLREIDALAERHGVKPETLRDAMRKELDR